MDVTTLLVILSAVIAATVVIAFVSRRAKAADAVESTHQVAEVSGAVVEPEIANEPVVLAFAAEWIKQCAWAWTVSRI